MPETKLSVLVVDDEEASRELVRIILEDAGYRTVLARSGEEAMQRVGEESFYVVITDLQMPGMDGSLLVQELRRHEEEIPVIVLTAFGSIESAVTLIKQGAFDYLRKPFDKEDLLLRIEKAIERSRDRSELRALRKTLQKQQEELGILGQSGGIREVMNKVSATAFTDFPVVIYGESGTGKGLVARAIHLRSNRARRPFLEVNCGAIPETLFENELFGHVKGAYTGALDTRRGLFEEAQGGSIFLDEIGEIPLPLQPKLLRVLEDRTVRKIGDSRGIQVDVRLICATNRDLAAAAEKGEFRQDLFYRINVIPIRIPPLRERREDIPLLSSYFLERANRSLQRPKQGFTREAIRLLSSQEWPGNVRELENKIKQSAILAKGDLVEADDILLSFDMGAPTPPGPATEVSEWAVEFGQPSTYREAKSRFELAYLTALLKRHGGNVTRAAEEADRYRPDLYALIRKYGLDPGSFRNG